MRVRLARAARQAIGDASRSALPHEACGLLFGERGDGAFLVSWASVAANVAAEPWHRFEVDPAHLFAAHRAAREGGPAILGVWHSHPEGPPRPSVHDAAGVTDPSWLWLIAAPEGPEVTLAAHLPDPRMPGGFRPLLLLDESGAGG